MDSLVCDFNQSPPEDNNIDTQYLKILSLNGCCEWTTDDQISRLSSGGKIQSAYFFRCYKISDKGILKLVQANGHSLVSLMLAGCSGISDRSLRYISQYCTQLKELDITRCPKVTDIGINYLVDLMGLESLNMYANTQLSTSSYEAIKSMHALRRIDFCGHSNLTSKDLLQIISNCHHLEYLNLSWCVGLDDSIIDYIVNEKRLGCIKFLSIFGIKSLEKVDVLVEYLRHVPSISQLDIRAIPSAAEFALDDCKLLREKIPGLVSWKLHT